MDGQTDVTQTQAVLVVQPAPPSLETQRQVDELAAIIISMCLPVYLLKLAIRQLNFDHD